MSVLPIGWAFANLSGITSLDGIVSDGDWVESKDQDPNGDVRLIQLADIGDGKFINKSNRFMNIEQTNRLRCTLLKEGDVLIARMPDPLGRACLFPELSNDAVTVVDVCLVRLTDSSALKNKLFMYWVNSPTIRNLVDMQASGTTRRRITRKKLALFDFPIPPLNEQARIVDKLDSILAKVNAAQARLDKIPNILKRFRQSVLAAATSGELIGENIDSWNNSPLVSLLSNIADCPHSTPKWTAEGKICVRTTALKPFNLDLTEQKNVSQETYIERTKRLEPKAGDILYSREGAILGIACQVPEGVELCLGQRMLVMRAGEKIDPQYLTIVLNSPLITDPIKSLTIGNAAPRINMSVIKNFNIPYPSLKKQKEIVRRFEAMFENATKVEKKYLKAKDHTNRLTQSILAKAFRGELVTQDENDEPAIELLTRIKEQAELQKPRKKAKK